MSNQSFIIRGVDTEGGRGIYTRLQPKSSQLYDDNRPCILNDNFLLCYHQHFILPNQISGHAPVHEGREINQQGPVWTSC